MSNKIINKRTRPAIYFMYMVLGLASIAIVYFLVAAQDNVGLEDENDMFEHTSFIQSSDYHRAVI